MSLATSYLFLGIAVFLGVTSNSFAKSAEGFTLLFPSIITAITIVLCMYALSLVMKNIPMGITYASFAGLTIIATVVVGIIRFNQVPNLYSLIGLAFIIVGVLMVNLLGNNDGFISRWFYSWMFAFPIALIAAFTMAPIIRPLVNKIASKE